MVTLPVVVLVADHLGFFDERQLFAGQFRWTRACPLQKLDQVVVVVLHEPLLEPAKVAVAMQRISGEANGL